MISVCCLGEYSFWLFKSFLVSAANENLPFHEMRTQETYFEWDSDGTSRDIIPASLDWLNFASLLFFSINLRLCVLVHQTHRRRACVLDVSRSIRDKVCHAILWIDHGWH